MLILIIGIELSRVSHIINRFINTKLATTFDN